MELIFVIKQQFLLKNKVLIISYDFYPDNSPNTYRWLNVLSEWEKRNIEIFVVSFQKSGFNNYEEFKGIKIYRTKNLWFESFKSIFINPNNSNSINVSKKLIKKKYILKKLHNITLKSFYFPDFAFSWKSAAFKKANEIILKEKIFNVVTVSWPFSDHVIGSKLKNKHKIFWIADTIDPFYLSTTVNNIFIYKKLNFIYEKNILNKADVVTLLTHKLKEKYASLFANLRNKLVVNHNIFVPCLLDKSNSVSIGSKIKLVFVGTLNPIYRSPKDLLIFFEQLLKNKSFIEDLELHFYGDVSNCFGIFHKFDYLLNKNLFLHGEIPRSKVPYILNSASILVNIGNKNEYQEPSKILEYVYFKKLILNIYSIPNDTSKEMLADYPFIFNLSTDDINNHDILGLFKLFCQNKVIINDTIINKILKKHMLSEVEQIYFKLLQN